MLFASLLNEMLPGMRYSSGEAAQKDLAEFQAYVQRLTVE